MKKFIKVLGLFLVFSVVFLGISFLPDKALAYSDGTLDTSFNVGTGTNNSVHSILVQPDGKIIIGGWFTSYNGIAKNFIARLNSNGTLDTSFNTGTGPNSAVLSMALQSDGKIIIGGDFTSFNGIPRNYIARLNSNGTLDTTFSPSIGANAHSLSISIQPDGKIIIGGNFTYYNGISKNYITRLNSDGSLDPSFNIGIGANNWVQSISLQSNGQIIIGGNFTSYNGTARNRIARLNSNGTLDTTFNPGTGADNQILSTYLQSNGQIIIGGWFTSYNGTAQNRIARLNSNGTLDTTFNPGTGPDSVIISVLYQPDGQIIIGGNFTSYNGTARNRIARLNSNGTLDTTFNPGTGTDSSVISLALQSNGNILLGGHFNFYNGISRNRIARLGDINPPPVNTAPVATNVLITGSPNVGQTLTGNYTYSDAENDLEATSTFRWLRNNVPITGVTGLTYTTSSVDIGQTIRFEVTPIAQTGVLVGLPVLSPGIVIINPIICSDGSLDLSFNSGTGANNFVYATALQPDGKVLIGGAFTSYNSTPRNYIARLNSDGTLDNSFNIGTGADAWVKSIVVQPDGKILIGGGFHSYNTKSREGIARLNSDGSLDASFNPGSGLNAVGDWVHSISLQPDGNIIIGGAFNYYNGIARNSIARIKADGSLDPSFNPGTGVNNFIYSTALQPDGKILIGGWFTSYNGTPRSRIARLNSDGSLDASFKPGAGANSWIQSVYLQPDGKILIGGDFTSYKSVPQNSIARLNPDASLDTSFKPGTGANSWLQSISVQSDGKIIIAGGFTSYNGTARNRIARLNSDGSLDPSFAPISGANNWIYPNTLQPDCKIIIGGHFTSYDGVAKNYVARLGSINIPATPINPLPQINSNIFQRTLKVATIGEDVKKLQTYLNSKLKANLKPDGIFGSLTKKAVMQFQMANALVADGIFGPLTKLKLK